MKYIKILGIRAGHKRLVKSLFITPYPPLPNSPNTRMPNPI